MNEIKRQRVQEVENIGKKISEMIALVDQSMYIEGSKHFVYGGRCGGKHEERR